MSTNLVSDDGPVDPVDERLVAYLDGELDTADRDSLEQSLIDDESLRQRLQDLQRGWDFLDDLPSAAPSEKLVETTMEMAVADLVHPKSQRSSWGIVRSRWPLVIVAVTCLCGLIGYLIVGKQREWEFASQVEDLRLAENLDAYLDGHDLDLMRRLNATPGWRSVVNADKDLRGIGGNNPLLSGVTRASLEERISQLSDAQAAELSARWNRFQSVDDETKQRIREVAKKVSVQPDAQGLLQTMRDYAIWKTSLPAETIDELEGRVQRDSGTKDSPERSLAIVDQMRSEAIESAIEQSQQSINRRSTQLLDDDSMDAIVTSLQMILQERLDDPASLESRSMDKIIKATRSFGRPESEVRKIVETNMVYELANDSKYSQRGGRPIGVNPLTEADLQTVELLLKSDDLDRLNALAAGQPLVRSTILRIWAADAAKRYNKPEQQSLLDRYLVLDQQQREKIDLAPPEVIQDVLTRDRRRGGRPLMLGPTGQQTSSSNDQ